MPFCIHSKRIEAVAKGGVRRRWGCAVCRDALMRSGVGIGAYLPTGRQARFFWFFSCRFGQEKNESFGTESHGFPLRVVFIFSMMCSTWSPKT
jgi:hypothetical protein